MIKYLVILLYCLVTFDVLAFENKKIKILCSTYPIYLITKNIITNNDRFTAELLIPAQTGCPHDYFTTPKDLQRISSTHILIINGLGLDDFLLTDLMDRINPDHEVKIINATQNIHSVIYKDGLNRKFPNPHLFASPLLFQSMISNIAKELSKLYPDETKHLQENTTSYIKKIQEISSLFDSLKHTIQNRNIITGHDAFDYLAHELNLKIIATLNLEHNQSLTIYKINDIITKIKKFKVPSIFIEPQYANKNSQLIAQETHITVKELDPVTTGPIEPPLDYYENTMLKNYETLKTSLGTK